MIKKILSTLAVSLIFLIGVFGIVSQAHAYLTESVNGITPATYQNYDFFASSTVPASDSVTWNATSTSLGATSTAATFIPYIDNLGRWDAGYFNVPGAKAVTFYFSDAGAAASSSTFYVQISPDGVNWYPFNNLVQNLATSTFPGITISSQVVTGTSTVIDSMNTQYATFQGVRCIVVVSGGGNAATCKASADF